MILGRGSTKKWTKCPNYDRHLKQALYKSLNYVTKPIVDAVCGGSFMWKPFAESMHMLDEVSKKTRAWYTRDAKVGELGYTYEMSTERQEKKKKLIRTWHI